MIQDDVDGDSPQTAGPRPRHARQDCPSAHASLGLCGLAARKGCSKGSPNLKRCAVNRGQGRAGVGTGLFKGEKRFGGGCGGFSTSLNVRYSPPTELDRKNGVRNEGTNPKVREEVYLPEQNGTILRSNDTVVACLHRSELSGKNRQMRGKSPENPALFWMPLPFSRMSGVSRAPNS